VAKIPSTRSAPSRSELPTESDIAFASKLAESDCLNYRSAWVEFCLAFDRTRDTSKIGEISRLCWAIRRAVHSAL
jgi:hypothetical protein